MGDVLVAGKNSIWWSYVDRLADENVYPKELNVVPFFKNTPMMYVDFIPSLYVSGVDTYVRIYVDSVEVTVAPGTLIQNASGLFFHSFTLSRSGNFTITVKSTDTLTTYHQSVYNAKIMYDPIEVFGVEMGRLRVEQQEISTDTIYTDVRDAQLEQNFARPMGVSAPAVFGINEFRSMLLGNSVPGIRSAFLRAGSIRGVKDVVRSITGIDPVVTMHRNLVGWRIYGPNQYGVLSNVYKAVTVPTNTDTAVNPHPFHLNVGGASTVRVFPEGTLKMLRVRGGAVQPSGYYFDGTDATLDNTDGWSLEIKVKVNNVSGVALGMEASDSVRDIRLQITNTFCAVYYLSAGWNLVGTYVFAFQNSGFHVIRMTVQGDNVNVYLDNNTVPVITGAAPAGAGVGAKYVNFGYPYSFGGAIAHDYGVAYFSWDQTRAIPVAAYDNSLTYPYVDENGDSIESDVDAIYTAAAVSDDTVATIYDGRYLDFSLTLLSRQSIRQVFQEAIVRNIIDPADITTYYDYLSNRFPLYGVGTPDQMYITQGASVWVEGTDFVVNDDGRINWAAGVARPADKSVYYVDYRFYMKDIITPLVERVKPAVSLIEYEFE